MRPRFAVLASVLTAFVAVIAPGLAGAAPRHNHGLTINATPNPVIAGDAVLIYGQLKGTNPGGQKIVLYHRVNPASHFTIVSTTTTAPTGFYEFSRLPEVVESDRSWFVRAPLLPGNIHSRTMDERVWATISLTASTLTADTNHRLVFTGHVEPNHAGERVFLQEQGGMSGDDWTTLKSGRLGPGSSFAIPYRFRVPGPHEVRVAFRGDDRNMRTVSNTVTVTLEQTGKPDFTISSSAPIVQEGSSATISGVLSLPGTTKPDPNVSVRLWQREDPLTPGHAFTAVGAPVLTGPDGSYSFTVTPHHNTEYLVRTTYVPPARRQSSVLFEGVRDIVTINASSKTSAVGQSVTFTGAVTPDKAGHLIELQRLAADGDFHTVARHRVDVSSAYKFVWTFGSPGTKTFRVHIPGGPENVGANSASEVITVALPPVSSLPPAS
jgi:hypothetical protein